MTDRGQATGAVSSPYEDVSDSTASESEYQHALEVVFNTENQRRRKASLVESEAELPRKDDRMQCKVHQMLECQRRARWRAATLKDLKEDQVLENKPVNGKAGGMDKHDGLYSRLMTKRQLIDMAVGVREMSQRLGNVKLKIKVKTVFILAKVVDDEVIDTARELADWLLDKEQDTPYIVYVEDRLEHNDIFNAKDILEREPSREGRLKYWNNELCRTKPQTFDFVVTLGGDGTVLYASWLFQRIVPPVLSFALGSLGFLTKFDFANYKSILSKSYREGVVVSLRLRFECTVMRSRVKGPSRQRDLVEELIGEAKDDDTHTPDGNFEILNDIVVDRGPNPTMSAIEVCGDRQHFTTVQADGVCVATPTGSTAYNLSAGGSLCHPDNPVILVTAICAHTLTFRPIILPDTVVLRIGVPYDSRTSGWASFDGRERAELNPGDYVTVSASRFPFAFVMPEGPQSEDWVNSISRTLQWNSRQRQKAFKEGGDGGEGGESQTAQ